MNSTAQFSALDLIPNIIAGLAFVGAVSFILIYATWSNWRATAPGKALMYWVISFSGLILMNTIHLYTGRYPGIEFVRIIVYTALTLSVWRLVATLIRITRGGIPITVSTFVTSKKEK
ncbi:hypothetical protein C5E11_03820 [Clavibacter michiganensis]|nr:hypothetical protein [Clavibacter michiganensis]PPF64529.1 hypothetical protein C5E11_03820 [Clavibacter michiganensis]